MDDIRLPQFVCSIVVPVVVLNPKRLEGFKIFSGHGELLDSGLCDAVVVSSPNMTHYQILMDIISHAKPHHILVEKPLCTTVQDCQKVSSNFGGSELCDVILMPAVLQNFTFMNTFKLCCSRCMWEVC
mgnify:CR=1 FL=1|jgi:hypothetical protein